MKGTGTLSLSVASSSMVRGKGRQTGMQRQVLAVWLAAFGVMLPALAGFGMPAAAQDPDLTIDGVPLPGDVAPLTRMPAGVPVDRRFAGTWVGAWGGDLKTILTFESIGADGTATAIYAVGDHALWGIERGWWRFSGRIEGKNLRIKGRITEITYELAPSGRLLTTYARRNQRSRAVLTRQRLAALRKPGAPVPWIGGKRAFLKTGLIEDGKRIRLEAVVFRPADTGPFPLAVVNHGSTGRGSDPRLFRQTFIAPMLAEYLTARGWLAAFPQRRGRGRSDGLYDEGFNADRTKGYTCRTKRSLAGADRALEDVHAAIAALRKRPDVQPGPVLLLGQSRGGALSVAYAGLHPKKVRGVIDFVGGWVGDGCGNAISVNRTLMNRGARFPRPMLWLYGRNDPYYPLDHSRGNFEAFRAAGGKGRFFGFRVPGGNGHGVMQFPRLWAAEVDRYLGALKSR